MPRDVMYGWFPGEEEKKRFSIFNLFIYLFFTFMSKHSKNCFPSRSSPLHDEESCLLQVPHDEISRHLCLYRKCILKIEGREWRKESETGTTIYRNKLNWNFDAVEWREIYKIFKIEMRRNMIEAASALCRMERKKISIYFVSTEVSTLRIVIK